MKLPTNIILLSKQLRYLNFFGSVPLWTIHVIFIYAIKPYIWYIHLSKEVVVTCGCEWLTMTCLYLHVPSSSDPVSSGGSNQLVAYFVCLTLLGLTRKSPSQPSTCIITTGIHSGMFGKHNGNTRIRHFDLLEMVWHQPQTSIITLMQLPRVVFWAKNETCNVRNQRYKIDYTGMYHFFYTSLKIFHNFKGIHHYIVNLWNFCVHSIIGCDQSMDNNLSTKTK